MLKTTRIKLSTFIFDFVILLSFYFGEIIQFFKFLATSNQIYK